MSETSPVRSGEHIDAERLRKYLEPHLGPWPFEPLRITQFVHGRSNLTYLLQVGDWQAVLRRPPYGILAPRSHDMAREFAWLQAIHPVFPWAPNPLWLCTDPEVIGATFLVMEKLPGVVVAERFPTSVSYTPELGAHLC
jgi:aminoglycoside phosphotransferase (APT) family kinase protein